MTTYTITFSGNELVIIGIDGRTRRLELPHPISSVEEAPPLSSLFVVTDPPARAANTPNLYRIDLASASVVWGKAADKSRSASNAFTQSRFDPDTQALTAWDWDGYRATLDPEDGQVKESHFFK